MSPDSSPEPAIPVRVSKKMNVPAPYAGPGASAWASQSARPNHVCPSTERGLGGWRMIRLKKMQDRASSGIERTGRGRSLAALAAEADRRDAVTRGDLRPGDWLIVTTRNSVYSLYLHEDGTYSVAGGWFDRQGLSPHHIGVSGCTFGGRAINREILAAPGLFLEFDNQVTTTRIREARIIRDEKSVRH